MGREGDAESKPTVQFRLAQSHSPLTYCHAGILAPRPIEHKLHVLVMDFIGKESKAALRLKDAKLSDEQSCKAHRDLCLVLWTLYSQCKLVHADFSEYNILYSQARVNSIQITAEA